MRNIDARANTKVINLDARRKLRATWDKPLTTEYTTNKQNNVKLYYFKKHKRQASSSKRRAAGYRLWK
jgi:uncharacterized protein (DUF2252 family)